jgi:hypothetical protein
MPPNGLIGIDMAGFDPVDDGLAGNPAVLAGLKYGENVFHGEDSFVGRALRLV